MSEGIDRLGICDANDIPHHKDTWGGIHLFELCRGWRPTPEPSPGTEKVYEVIKFVSTALAIDALEGLAVHCVAGPNDPDVHGVLYRRSDDRDSFMVTICDPLTDEPICATDIRNFVEVIVP